MQRGTCRHFTGLLDECCSCGINYDAVRLESKRLGAGEFLPCFAERPLSDGSIGQGGYCASYEEPSEADLEAYAAGKQRTREMASKLLPVLVVVKLQHAGEDWVGELKCPVCDGALAVSHRGQSGHTSGKCGTAGCLSWVE